MTRLRKRTKVQEETVKDQENEPPKTSNIRKGTKRKTFDQELASQIVETLGPRKSRTPQNVKNNDNENHDQLKTNKPQERGTLKDIFLPVNKPLSESSPGRLENSQSPATETSQTSSQKLVQQSNSPAKKRSKLSLKGAKDGPKQLSVQKLFFEKGCGQKSEKTNTIEMDKEKEKTESVMEIIKPPCVAALHNLGNTCFLNSVLQVLRYTPRFKSSIADLAKEIKVTQKEKQVVADLSKDSTEKNEEILTWRLITSLHDAFRKMQVAEDRHRKGQTQYIATRPYDLLDTLERLNPMFEGNYQQDAHELLRCLLAYIQDASKEINSYRSKHRKHGEVSGKENAETSVEGDKSNEMTKTFESKSKTIGRESKSTDNEAKIIQNETESTENETSAVENRSKQQDTNKGKFEESETVERKPKQINTLGSYVTVDLVKIHENSENETELSFTLDNGSIVSLWQENNMSDNEKAEHKASSLNSECEVMLLSEDSKDSVHGEGKLQTRIMSEMTVGEKPVKTQVEDLEEDKTFMHRENEISESKLDGGCDLISDGGEVKVQENEFPKGLKTEPVSPRENVFEKFDTLGMLKPHEQLDGACDTGVKDTEKSGSSSRSRASLKIRASSKDNMAANKLSSRRTRSKSNPNKEDDGNVSEKENVFEEEEKESLPGVKTQRNTLQNIPKTFLDGKNIGYDIASFFKKKSVVCLERCDPQNSSYNLACQDQLKTDSHEASDEKGINEKQVSECSVKLDDVLKKRVDESLSDTVESPSVASEQVKTEGTSSEKEEVAIKLESNDNIIESKNTVVKEEFEKSEKTENDQELDCLSKKDDKHIAEEQVIKPVQKTPSKCRRVGLSRNQVTQSRLQLTRVIDKNVDVTGEETKADNPEGEWRKSEENLDSDKTLSHDSDQKSHDIEMRDVGDTTAKPDINGAESVVITEKTSEGVSKGPVSDTAEIASPNTTLKNEARNKKSVVRIKKCSISSFFRRPPQNLEDVPRVTAPVTDCVESLFQGSMALRTKCLVCERYTERKEAYQDISVPVKKPKPQNCQKVNSNLSDDEDEGSGDPSSWIFSSLAEVECLRDDNKYFCDNCLRLGEAHRSMHYITTPDLLTLHLKRFAALSGYFGGFTKISDYVPTPFILPCIQDNCKQNCTEENHRYELYGVVTHTGFSLSSGHYVAYVKAPPGTKMESPPVSSTPVNKQQDPNGNFQSEENKDKDNRNIPEISPTAASSESKYKTESEVSKDATSKLSDNKCKNECLADTEKACDSAVASSVENSSAVWYECDDEIVTEMSQSSFEEILSPGSASSPYMLFYRRVGLVKDSDV